MAADCIGARPLDIRRELSPGIHEPHVIASATDANHCHSGDDRHNRDRDD